MFTLKTYTVSLVRSCLALKTNKTHHVFCTDLFHHILSPLNHLIAHYATTLLNNWTNCPELKHHREGMSSLKTECCNVLQEKIMLNYVYYV